MISLPAEGRQLAHRVFRSGVSRVLHTSTVFLLLAVVRRTCEAYRGISDSVKSLVKYGSETNLFGFVIKCVACS